MAARPAAATSETRVGIRDFKTHAPGLIARAVRGERIIITRYGKPRAELRPLAEQPAEAPAPRVRAWLKEEDAFKRMGPRRLRPYRGQYVAVHRGQIVDADADHETLYRRVRKALGDEVVFYGRVGGLDEVKIPGFEIVG